MVVHTYIHTCNYRVAGNFRRVQIFMDFADWLVSPKIKNMGVVTSCKKVSRVLELRSIEGTKIKTTKIADYGAIP